LGETAGKLQDWQFARTRTLGDCVPVQPYGTNSV
jgi:hypothetical protein